MSFCDTVLVTISSIEDKVKICLDAIHSFGNQSSNYGSLAAAIIVAVLLFAVREFSIKAKNYSGIYYAVSTVEDTSYNPFREMKMFHTLVLFSDGYVISGTTEKTGDIDKIRSYEYEGSGKIRGEVSGRVERNYFGSSVMNLHIVEQGKDRESTSFMTIKVRRFRFLNPLSSGSFYSTAARTKGSVLCGREPFKEHPIGHVPFQSTAESQSSNC
ncbi:hypothetical protein IQ22_00330 [Pseudomonas duriflava]|uniref:Uncharacterized protein n=2 Tax=Pseudomonas duriflava TaxID=459528 RepID=A0A562QPE6_9PSED|nr:hypothetical protein IQ22_00330 [Pseudomonas duriflava]